MAATASLGPEQAATSARFKGRERRLCLFVAGRQSHITKGVDTERRPGLQPFLTFNHRQWSVSWVLFILSRCHAAVHFSAFVTKVEKGLGKAVGHVAKGYLNCPSLGSQPSCSTAWLNLNFFTIFSPWEAWFVLCGEFFFLTFLLVFC